MIGCNDCKRTWHKTCVGIEEGTPLAQIEWSRCSQCGGKDPKGKMLKKRRKVAKCPVCFDRIRGKDHKKCREERTREAENYVSPAAGVNKQNESNVRRKRMNPPQENRNKHIPKRKRGKTKDLSTETQVNKFTSLL